MGSTCMEKERCSFENVRIHNNAILRLLCPCCHCHMRCYFLIMDDQTNEDEPMLTSLSRLRRPHEAEEVYVTGTFDNWSKSEQLHKVGDHFEKTVTLPDSSEPIFYKVRGFLICWISFGPLLVSHLEWSCSFGPSHYAPSFLLEAVRHSSPDIRPFGNACAYLYATNSTSTETNHLRSQPACTISLWSHRD
jgi:hypothetical protein